jgi:hypothetical protein
VIRMNKFSAYCESIQSNRTNTGYKGISYYENRGMFVLREGRSVVGSYQSLNDALQASFIEASV